MTKLSDPQCILLSTASQRGDGSVLPLPAGIKAGGGAAKALAALLKREFVVERETMDASAVHRTDGDLRYGLFLTLAGAGAIGVEPEGSAATDDIPATQADPAAPSPAPAVASKRPTKAAAVLVLLSRPDGATLGELVEATGWLPHTTRAALTGLRKKGHDVQRGKRGGATCYRVTGQA